MRNGVEGHAGDGAGDGLFGGELAVHVCERGFDARGVDEQLSVVLKRNQSANKEAFSVSEGPCERNDRPDEVVRLCLIVFKVPRELRLGELEDNFLEEDRNVDFAQLDEACGQIDQWASVSCEFGEYAISQNTCTVKLGSE